MTIKTIFLDRDGVINKEVNYLYKIKDFEFIDGIFEACLHFQELGYRIIIISNQSGISRGFYSEEDYKTLNLWMLNQFKSQGVKILNSFYCAHLPKSNCNCRKPKPGMLIEANKIHNINFNNSWLIGDKETDIQAANASGIYNTILVRSGHLINEYNSNSLFIIDSIKESTKIIVT
jgi:D-glycero-D-manno-heptose 1,7-bisphosphate phosphatase